VKHNSSMGMCQNLELLTTLWLNLWLLPKDKRLLLSLLNDMTPKLCIIAILLLPESSTTRVRELNLLREVFFHRVSCH